MSKVLHHKVVAALPDPLGADSVYYVRKGAGFEIYVTNGVGVVTAYELNRGDSGVPAVRAPIPMSPLTGGALVGEKPELVASPFAPAYSVDTLFYRLFEVALSTDPNFTSPVFTQEIVDSSAVISDGLAKSTSYLWRCRDFSTAGDVSEWSVTQTIVTTDEFNSFIPTPTPTPAIGASFEGGFYMGLFWNQIAQSTNSKTLMTGSQSFSISVDMSVTPIVYEGQTIEVRSRSNPSNRFKGVVTGALGSSLDINVTEIGGSGTFSDWSVMAQFRNIVAPKASGDNGSIAIKNAATALPEECHTLTEGWLATEAMRLADTSTVYPAAHWARGLSIGGYTDWHIPARDVLELCYRNGKPATGDNITTTNAPTSVYDFKNRGSFGNDSNVQGINNNSIPIGVAYTASVPAQTTVSAFKTGGTESLTSTDIYKTCTATGSTDSVSLYFDSGRARAMGVTLLQRVRAVRRSII